MFKGKHHSDESKRKNREAHLGKKLKLTEVGRENLRKRMINNSHALGKHHKLSEETKKRQSEGQKQSFKNGRKQSMHRLGSHHTEESKKKMSQSLMGRVSPRKGVVVSEETRRKMSLSGKGKKHSEETKIKMQNRIHSKETRRKMSLSHGGTGITQRTDKRYYHIVDSKYRKWRSGVFERDNWTCQTCGNRSKAGEPVYLEAHHIKG